MLLGFDKPLCIWVVVGCGLWVVGCGLWVVGWGLGVGGFGAEAQRIRGRAGAK